MISAFTISRHHWSSNIQWNEIISEEAFIFWKICNIVDFTTSLHSSKNMSTSTHFQQLKLKKKNHLNFWKSQFNCFKNSSVVILDCNLNRRNYIDGFRIISEFFSNLFRILQLSLITKNRKKTKNTPQKVPFPLLLLEFCDRRRWYFA